ncbi:hypothetical protein D9M68_898750 [compost metagenome]
MRLPTLMQTVRNDAMNIATCRQCGIGDNAHQSLRRPAIYGGNALIAKRLAQRSCAVRERLRGPEV